MNKNEKASTLEAIVTIAGGIICFALGLLFCCVMTSCDAKAQTGQTTEQAVEDTLYMPEYLIESNLVFKYKEDSIFLTAIINKWLAESHYLDPEEDEEFYGDVFLETDRPWDYLEFFTSVLSLSKMENGIYVRVNWESVDEAYFTLFGNDDSKCIPYYNNVSDEEWF